MRKARTSGGFTLIEVVLALGIVAGGLLLLLALVPFAFESLRDAANRTTERLIADRIIGEAQQGSWLELKELDGELLYADIYGIELDPDTSDDDLSYNVRIRVPVRDIRLDHDEDLKDFPPPLPLPGETTPNSFTEGNVRRILVDVVAWPERDFDFDAAENASRIRTFAGIVANMEDTDL